MTDSNDGFDEIREINVEEKKTSSQQTPTINEKDKQFVAELCREGETSQKTRSDNIELPKIQKVPAMLLSNPEFKKFYKPKVMIIGPLHRPSLRTAPKKELFKRNLASKFVTDNRADGNDLLGEIKRHVGELKGRFNEDDFKDYDDDTFAQMLFVDGCAVLQFISSFVSTNLKEVKINTGQAVLIQQDLLLLENQIPYQVLKLLIKKLPKENSDSMRQRVEEFILLSLMVPHTSFDSRLVTRYSQFFKNIDGDGSANQPAHLLDFLRLAILLDDDWPSRRTEKERVKADESAVIDIQEVAKEREEADETASGMTEKEIEEADENASGSTEKEREEAVTEAIINLKQLFKVFRYSDALYFHPSRFFSRWSFRNVQDLRASGIRLRPSNSPRLTDVKFSSSYFFWGELKLPALVVDESTSRKLLNLVAFEMCPDNYKNDFTITSYLSFLDSLIDIDQDVNDLRRAHILRNHLTSDSDVTKLFNTIGSNLFPDDTFDDIKNEIQKYYDRRSGWWVAQIYRDHFRNPWTILALLAGMIALLLTAVQTWFTVFRSN